MFSKKRIMLYRLKLISMQTELSKIVQNSEESVTFLHEKRVSLCMRKYLIVLFNYHELVSVA